jgi:hypothetical protein
MIWVVPGRLLNRLCMFDFSTSIFWPWPLRFFWWPSVTSWFLKNRTFITQ